MSTAPSQPTSDDFIQRSARMRPQRHLHTSLDPLSRAQLRRSAGLLIGVASGLMYAITSQVVNAVKLEGLPLYQPPFGLVPNVLLYVILGGVIGAAAIWREKVQRYFLLALVLILLGVVVFQIIQKGQPLEFATFVDFLTNSFFTLSALVIVLALLFPFMLLVRWAIDLQAEHHELPWFAPRRVTVPLLALAAAALAGSMYMFTAEEIRAIRLMDALMLKTVRVVSTEQLPVEFQTLTAAPFLTYAKGPYQFVADRSLQDMEILPGPFHGARDTLAGVKFDNGYSVVCRFPDHGPIECKANYHPFKP